MGVREVKLKERRLKHEGKRHLLIPIRGGNGRSQISAAEEQGDGKGTAHTRAAAEKQPSLRGLCQSLETKQKMEKPQPAEEKEDRKVFLQEQRDMKGWLESPRFLGSRLRCDTPRERNNLTQARK